jgi:transcriptional antiterminator
MKECRMTLIQIAAICILERSRDAQTFDDFIEYVARELVEYIDEDYNKILDELVPMMNEYIHIHFPVISTNSRSRASTIELIPAIELEEDSIFQPSFDEQLPS